MSLNNMRLLSFFLFFVSIVNAKNLSNKSNSKYKIKKIYVSNTYELKKKLNKFNFKIIDNFIKLKHIKLSRDNSIYLSMVLEKNLKNFKTLTLKSNEGTYNFYYVNKYKIFFINTKNGKNGMYISRKDLFHTITNYNFIKPLKYVYISSSFSKHRFHPILKKYLPHNGIDFVNYKNTPIVASQSGEIIKIGRNGSYGNYIAIKHKNGFVSEYGHLNNFVKGLKKGSYVKQGQRIAYLGNTGRSTGPHLHFGLKLNNKFINPIYFFKDYKPNLKKYASKNRYLLKNISLKRAINKKNKYFKTLIKNYNS